MLSKMYIEQYRGLKNLKIDNFGMINIIAGANNTGKTSILEVIQSLEAPNNIRNWRFLARREGNSMRISSTVFDTMNSIFPVCYEKNENKKIQYCVCIDNKDYEVKLCAKYGKTVVTQKQLEPFYHVSHEDMDDSDNQEYDSDCIDISYYVNNQDCGQDRIYELQRGMPPAEGKHDEEIIKNIVYVSPVQHAQNTVYLNDLISDPQLYQQFVEIMKQFDPNFISINAIEGNMSNSRKYVVLSKNHKEGLLLNAYGDGMKKAFLLLSAVLRAKNGILLLDEFETAIHISAMKSVFEWIIKTAMDLNVQIFMTSHSLEAIETVLKCNSLYQSSMRMITLANINDTVKVRNVDGKKAIQLLDEYGMELR